MGNNCNWTGCLWSVADLMELRLMLNDTTMADKMLEAGYDTHAIGKWHMVGNVQAMACGVCVVCVACVA